MSNLVSSVYSFNNNESEAEKSGIKTTYQAGKVAKWSRGQVSDVAQETQGLLEREHVYLRGTFTRDHVTAQVMLAREHMGT